MDKDSNAKIEGTVVLLMKKNDCGRKLLGQGVSLQLITSASNADSAGKLGNPAHLDWIPSESAFKVTFDLNNDIGIPGAFLIKNNHQSEFYLKSLTLKDVPAGQGPIHFVCNSWVYPAEKYKNVDRVFFSNKTYLPSKTPEPLQKYRKEELVNLRGDGTGERQEWDRVYDYAYYNDLGNPEKGDQYARPVLGGSAEYPYPRRGRTGRPPTVEDSKSETRLPPVSLDIYVPRDERFDVSKMSDFVDHALKSKSIIEHGRRDRSLEFDSFEDVLKLYEGGIKLNDRLLKYPMPQVIEENRSAWRTDEEFAREMLAGVNPVHIRRLEEFPPSSKLDPEKYGNQASTITKERIKNITGGLSIDVDEEIRNKKLFILDHHDAFMPYLRNINSTSTKTYASRTILFLTKDGTLKPLAIELSVPHPEGDKRGAISEVYTPSEEVVKSYIWQLAKAYVAVNDSGYHHLISHWLNTHAVIEPFVIATNRQLSVVHPIHKLLHPHFRDTMHINALARQTLINAGGFLESTVFPANYSMEMSSAVYKNWAFHEQALPEDLIKRGMAVKDSESPHGLRLLIEDYPYAVDGLEIWSAIKTWVKNYSSFYYRSDEEVQNDTELQFWWKELKEEGHGDKKDEPGWPQMQTCEELVQTCTIIIWIASALHAAVNFGQYPYAGYLPNRPTTSRRFMPKEDTPEYEELGSDPDKVFLKTITARLQTLLGVSLIELLSKHSSNEVYLGKRDTLEWTMDAEPLKAFEKFGQKLAEIQDSISDRNNNENLKNRVGPVKVPYTLLYPTGEDGITGKGIPNSVSI